MQQNSDESCEQLSWSRSTCCSEVQRWPFNTECTATEEIPQTSGLYLRRYHVNLPARKSVGDGWFQCCQLEFWNGAGVWCWKGMKSSVQAPPCALGCTATDCGGRAHPDRMSMGLAEQPTIASERGKTQYAFSMWQVSMHAGELCFSGRIQCRECCLTCFGRDRSVNGNIRLTSVVLDSF